MIEEFVGVWQWKPHGKLTEDELTLKALALDSHFAPTALVSRGCRVFFGSLSEDDVLASFFFRMPWSFCLRLCVFAENAVRVAVWRALAEDEVPFFSRMPLVVLPLACF